jgi:hypothetical protein
MQAEAANALGAGPTLLPPCFISHPDVVEEKMPEEMAALMMFLYEGKQDRTNKYMRSGAQRFWLLLRVSSVRDVVCQVQDRHSVADAWHMIQ